MRQETTTLFEPPLELWPDAGVYQLWLRVSAEIVATVGRLGRFRFPAGRYVYVGRAARELLARVRRYTRRGGGRHWHIDYLLARREVQVERILLASRDPAHECPIAQAIGGEIVVAGFGASDCRAGCGAHLKYVGCAGGLPMTGPVTAREPLARR